MYARSTTILAHPENIDRGITQVRDIVMPAVLDAPGCIGMSMLVDRDSGRCIATTAWESADAMRDSEPMIRPLRDRAADMLGGSAQVDEWEIGVLHRDHRSAPGACVRVSWLRLGPAAMDRGLDMYRHTVMPMMERMDGFCSASLLMDRAEGITVSSVTFDSVDAMMAGRDEGERMRANVSAELGAEVLEVAEFELALAHLRVPELV
ncbi:MAG: antibiotic biosynthesis monooxygenase [Pseudonocardia sp.]|nr:antibiotic biosynthesis monooxygenase [Pseudonocardia sp.]